MHNEIPDTLTLDPCNCPSKRCDRTGFKEGMFYQGCGFDKHIAEEIKKRYDAYPVLMDEISQLRELCEE